MAYKQNGVVAFSNDLGITDTTTAPSNQTIVTEGTPGTNNYFGADVDIYGSKLYVRSRNSLLIYTYDLDGQNEAVFWSGAGSAQGGTLVSGNGYIYTSGATVDDVIIIDMGGNVVKSFSFPVATNDNTVRYGAAYGKLVVADPGYNSNTGRVYIYDAVGNLIRTIENPENTIFDFFGDTIFIASGKLIISARGDDDGGLSDGAYYIYDISGNYISKRSFTNNHSTNGQLKVKAVGNGRIVSKVIDHDGNSSFSNILIDDMEGNNISSIPDPGSVDYWGDKTAIGHGRIVVVTSTLRTYDLNGNFISTTTPTPYNNSNPIANSGLIIKNGKIVISDYAADVNPSFTNDGVVYIYDTPSQTHYLDILD